MITDFVDAVRERLHEGGFAKIRDEVETGGEFLVGYRGRLFYINSDFDVGESVDEFNACGGGAQVALGAMHATETSNDPAHRLYIALRAAECFSAGVRGPFNYVATEGNAAESEDA